VRFPERNSVIILSATCAENESSDNGRNHSSLQNSTTTVTGNVTTITTTTTKIIKYWRPLLSLEARDLVIGPFILPAIQMWAVVGIVAVIIVIAAFNFVWYCGCARCLRTYSRREYPPTQTRYIMRRNIGIVEGWLI